MDHLIAGVNNTWAVYWYIIKKLFPEESLTRLKIEMQAAGYSSTSLFIITVIAVGMSVSFSAAAQPDAESFFKSNHTNNWAVIVDTSRYWFNYRHVANALSFYRSVKRLGVPDSRIILMLADDMACNPRNPHAATVFNNKNEAINVYGDDVEVDYRGYEVTVENFIRVLTGRLPETTPRSKRLLTDERSNVLVYMTGHGGDGFLKFQDSEEISSDELADAFGQMHEKLRYHELLFIIDTCQAASMFQKFYSPNLIGIASSKVGEDSLSHHIDPAIGVYVIDRYTYYALEFLEKVTSKSQKTLGEFLKVCPRSKCKSTVATRTDLFARNPDEVLITDFFGSVRNVELLPKPSTAAKKRPDSLAADHANEPETKSGSYIYLQQFPTF